MKIKKLPKPSIVCLAITITGTLSCFLLGKFAETVVWTVAVIGWAACRKVENERDSLKTQLEQEREIAYKRDSLLFEQERKIVVGKLKSEVTQKILLKKTYETEYLRGEMSKENYEQEGKRLYEECDEIMVRLEKLMRRSG